jgi:hypothetical protein
MSNNFMPDPMETASSEETRIKQRPVAKFSGLGLVCLGAGVLHSLPPMDFSFNPYTLLAGFLADGTPLDAEKLFTGLPPDAGSFFNFNAYNILAGIVFGTLGWGAFSYGKRLDLWQPRAIGVALMVYPYLFSNAWLLWGVGVALLIVLWFYHDE